MFLGYTLLDTKTEIVEQCGDDSAPLRLIFATSSFGMGVDCSGVYFNLYIIDTLKTSGVNCKSLDGKCGVI